jgi:hypothetical protein
MKAGKRTAMYIGKFDPPQNGHINVPDWLFNVEGFERVIIVIGSKYSLGTKIHPLPASIREKMFLLSCVLRGLDIEKIEVVHLPDFGDFKKWYGHIRSLQRKFGVEWLVTGNHEMIISQIEKHNQPVPFARIFDPEKEMTGEYVFPFHATEMRKCIYDGDWEGFKKIAAPGTLLYMGAVNGIDAVRQALDRDVNLYVEGRQAVDAIIINNYEGRKTLICGYRGLPHKDRFGELAIPGGPIHMYESPESAVVREVRKRVGLEIEILERYLEPSPLLVNNTVLTQMKSVGIFSTRDPKVGHSKGGSCQPFLIEFSLPEEILTSWLRSSRELASVALRSEDFVREKGLAFQQLAMVQKAGFAL